MDDNTNVEVNNIDIISGPPSVEEGWSHVSWLEGHDAQESVDKAWEVQAYLDKLPYSILAFVCDVAEGTFTDAAVSVSPATQNLVKAEIYRRAGGQPQPTPADRPDMRVEPDVDVVFGDCGVACRGHRDVYWRSFGYGSGADSPTSNESDSMLAQPDDVVGLALLAKEFGDDGVLDPEFEKELGRVLHKWEW